MPKTVAVMNNRIAAIREVARIAAPIARRAGKQLAAHMFVGTVFWLPVIVYLAGGEG